MPRARPESQSFAPFFRGLRDRTVATWQSRDGYDYDSVLYSIHYPFTEADLDRIFEWVGRGSERRQLPPVAPLNKSLESATYPALAAKAPRGVSAQAWSAVLHFCDPSYPLYTDGAAKGLERLGFEMLDAQGPKAYPAFLAAVDTLKEQAPVWSIPETNWYLARVIEVGLGSWTAAKRQATARGASKARA